MSKRVYTFAAVAGLLLALSFWLWPAFQSKETINNSPAPRAPAGVPRKLDQVLPRPQPSRARIRLPEPTESAQAGADRQSDFISRYRVGGPKGGISVADGRFELLSLRAVPAARYVPDMGHKVSEKLGYVIFASSRPPGTADDESLLVVAKKSNGMLGIVTGTIIVRLKEAALALDLANSYKLTLKYIDDDLRLAYYSTTEDTSLAQIVEILKQDDAVETVNLEIVNSKKRL